MINECIDREVNLKPLMTIVSKHAVYHFYMIYPLTMDHGSYFWLYDNSNVN